MLAPLCPLTAAINPGTEAARLHTRDWARRLGLAPAHELRRLQAIDHSTTLVGWMFPSAAVRELELIADFAAWLFCHDDLCDESLLGEDPVALRARAGGLLATLTGCQPGTGEPFDRALRDLRERLLWLAPSPAWFLRFVLAVDEYFEACVCEAIDRSRREVPALEAFLGMRRCASGMGIGLVLVELALRGELPLVARTHPAVQRLMEATCNLGCWHNDVFSLEKEVAAGEVHNLALVLVRENGISLAEAQARAVIRCNEEMTAFLALSGRLPRLGTRTDAELSRYRAGLEAMVAGNFEWSRGTSRYAGPRMSSTVLLAATA